MILFLGLCSLWFDLVILLLVFVKWGVLDLIFFFFFFFVGFVVGIGFWWG